MLALGVAAPGLDPGLEGGEGSSHGFSDELAAELLRFFDDRDNDYLVRAHVPTTLARLAPYVSAELARTVKERLVAVVTRKVKDRNEVLQSAVVALGLVGDMDEDPVDAAIRAALMQNAAGGSDQLAGFFARIALGKAAARAGDGAGDPTAGELEVRRFLYELLEKDKSQSRPWTAVAMGVMGFALDEQGKGLSTSELNALRYGLAQADSPSIMGAFGIALGLASDGLCIEALSAKIEGTSEEVARGYMALGIGLTGNHEGTRALEGVLRSSLNKPAALERAAIAMILVGNRDIVPELLELYESTGSLVSRISLVRALGRTGDERAARPLVDVMRDDESPALLRAWSAASLGWLADAAELPYTAALSVDVNYLASPPTLTSRGGDGIIDFR
jgi:HEAT repeat protein